jgi:hypothetical protein
MEPEEKEKMVLEGIELSEDMLFYGSVIKLEELVSLASRCIEEIENTGNVRLIILETWLFIDFCTRELLMSGLGLNEVNLENYDLRVNLLPKSFIECIKIIKRIKEVHKVLPRDPMEKSIRLPIGFLLFMKKQYPDFFSQFLDIEQEYYKEYAPELVKKDHIEQATVVAYKGFDRTEYSRIPKAWLEAVNRIDEDWIKSVKKLNLARNYAAHSYNSEEVLKRMGYSGANAVNHLKAECLRLVKNLIGIAKAAEETMNHQANENDT